MARPRLLIVDDDPDTRIGLSELLESAGFDCAEAETYQDALRILQTAGPDLLITDIRLGGYNGLQLVIGRPPSVPAIVITGFPDSVLESEAERYGARYIHKPVNPGELVRLVRQMLQSDGADGDGSD